eukprot:CCRYP_006016-RB/>CCRYP_006016-RB protein AED:0.44 eAED:0.43 QI:0/-1/0/1/-1/1/1/0/200
MTQLKQLLDYIPSQEPSIITYHKSGMVYSIHGDAGYLNEANACSRAGGHHDLSDNQPFSPNNGAILTVSEIINAVMSSAVEAELGALYVNACKGVEIPNILEELGHRQPPIPIQTDNSTAESIINSRVQPKQTKAMDMRFHWLRNRSINQNQFCFFWRPGHTNLANYWTKHHPASHHRNMRREFFPPFQHLLNLRQRAHQ